VIPVRDRHLVQFLSLCSLLGAVRAQSDWSEVYPVPRREYVIGAFPYETGNQALLMFGGLMDGGEVPLGDTWIWDGTKWNRHDQANGPSRRNAAAMCEGPDGTLVMFGGLNAGAMLSDTWVWSNYAWELKTPITSPPARDLHAMAFDATRGVVVMFGGTDAAGAQRNDTWEWDGSTWTQVVSAFPPAAREGHVMAFHPSNGFVYMLGGWTGGFTPISNQVWVYDGSTGQWTNQPVVMPTALAYHVGGYDPVTDAIVWGGGTGNGPVPVSGAWRYNPGSPIVSIGTPIGGTSFTRYGMANADTDGTGARFFEFLGAGAANQRSALSEFSFNGSTWVRTVVERWVGPGLTNGSAMAYDEARQRLVLVTGSRWVNGARPAFGAPPPLCHEQNPGAGTPGSSGYWRRNPTCNNFIWEPGKFFDDFIGDWSVGETFEFGGTLPGVDLGWERAEPSLGSLPVLPGSTFSAGGGVALAYVRGNQTVYRLGGYSLGQFNMGQFGLWQTAGVCNLGQTCFPGPTTRFSYNFVYNPLATFALDGGVRSYLGVQPTGSAWSNAVAFPNGGIAFHAMVAHQQRGELVVFGGVGASPSTASPNLFTFDTTTQTWTNTPPPVTMPPTPWPTVRMGHAMAYDERRNVIVMFGGWDLTTPTGAVRADTWELRFDTPTSSWQWTEVDFTGSPGLRPGPRMQHTMVYDPVRQRVVLTGGIAGPFLDVSSGAWPFRTKPTLASMGTYPTTYGDVWEWNGLVWELRRPNDPRLERFASAAAWDPSSEKVVVYGGMTHAGILPNILSARTETLDRFGPEILAGVSPLGTSCPTSGNPMTSAAGQRPYTGTTIDLAWIDPNPSVPTFPVVVIGFTQVTTNLAFLGLPACNLFETMDITVPLGVGVTQFSLALPDTVAGLGAPVWIQSGLFDATTLALTEVTGALRLDIRKR
jgi:hypothetical protein